MADGGREGKELTALSAEGGSSQKHAGMTLTGALPIRPRLPRCPVNSVDGTPRNGYNAQKELVISSWLEMKIPLKVPFTVGW